MCHSEDTFEGFVVRCFSNNLDRRNYASLVCDICDSVEEVASAIVEELDGRIQDDSGCEPLSEEMWERVRAKIIETANPPVWEFEPCLFDELTETNAPDSIKVNQVRLSRRLVERIQNGK